MRSSPPVELVVTSFDDPLVTGLRVEREAGSGTAPSGTAPSGTAPSGTAPSGTARRGGPSPSGMPGGPPPPDAGLTFLVARQAGSPVGYAGLRRLGDDTAEVEGLYVRPEFRGLGISRLLLAGVEDLARRRGFAVARLEAGDLRAAGLYASSGYVRIAPFGRHPARSVCFEKSLLVPVPRDRITGTFSRIP